MKAALRAYFTVSALYTFGRVLPQAVLTPILTSKGLSFSDILIVQICFTVTALIVEFPAGYLADRFSRKAMYLAAFVLMAASYLVVFIGAGLGVMCLAWILYGCASATQSSTMELTFVEGIRDDPAALRVFHARDRNIILGSSVLAALLSGAVYPTLGEYLYVISFALFVIAFTIGVLSLPGVGAGTVSAGHQQAFPVLVRELRAALNSRAILVPLALLAGTELAITPFFNLWQMVLVERELAIGWFGLVFIAFQLLNIAANVLFARIPPNRRVVPVCLTSVGIVGLMLAVSQDVTFALIALIALPLPLFLYIAQVTVQLQQEMPARVMSSIGSVSATAEAAMSLIVLAVSSALLEAVDPTIVLGIFLVVFALTALLLSFQNSKEIRTLQGSVRPR